MADLLFVSINRTFDHAYTLPQLAPWVARAWKTTPAKAEQCDRVIAVFHGEPVAAWRLRGAFYAEETWGDGHRRVALSLGDPLPILPAYRNVPMLRAGVALATREDVTPLLPERGEEWLSAE